MRYSLAALLIFACGCRQAAPDVQHDSAVAVAARRDTLARLGAEDQADRDSVGVASAREDTLYFQRLAHSDSVRSLWLQAHVATQGWPRRSIVGDRAAKAAWLMIQHSPDFNFQAAMLPELTKLASMNEISPADARS